MLPSRLSRLLLVNGGHAARRVLLGAHVPRRASSHDFDPKAYQMSMTGNREQVGYGINGQPMYCDRPDFPFPALRFMEPVPDLQALRGKERGDWRLLTREEKKRLYRSSFCQTYAEFMAPTGEWKHSLGWAIIFCCMGVWLFILEVIFVYDKYPASYSEESRMAQMRRMINLHTNPVTGIGSEWDYDRKEWKNKGWFSPPNPFIDPCTGEYLPDDEY